MKHGYLEPTDADAFKDMERLAPEPAASMYGRYRCKPPVDSTPVVECGQCKGFGGWNLKLDAYALGRHFKASCNNCNGWGYVPASQGDHVHEWDAGETVGRCVTRYTCITCKKVSDVDSSD